VEIRGTAELIEGTSKSLPKYLGEDPPPEPDEVRRLTVRVTPLSKVPGDHTPSQAKICPLAAGRGTERTVICRPSAQAAQGFGTSNG
jgi:hypothetical protein